INITGGPDLTLYEVNEASTLIQEAAHEDANIIFGSVIDENMRDEVKITVIATGFERREHRFAQDARSGAGYQAPIDPRDYPTYMRQQPRPERAPQERPLAERPTGVFRPASHTPLPARTAPERAEPTKHIPHAKE